MLKMQKLKLSEKYSNGESYFEYDEINLHNINLIIGPNASGKSQFFARLKFLKEFHLKNRPTPIIVTTFIAKSIFKNEEGELITYNLEIGSNQKIKESISGHSKKYLEQSNDNGYLLLDEKSNKKVSLLINKRISVTKQIEDYKNKFSTIYKIGSFFENILFLNTDKFNPSTMDITPNLLIVNDNMANISSVLFNWKNGCPNIYKNLLEEYKKFFPYIEDFSFTQMAIQNPNGYNNNVLNMLELKEKNIKKKIPVINISAGMLRVLCLLALPMSRKLSLHVKNNIKFKPSMIVIDEIDNGLDYETLENIIDYLESESSFAQIAFSSHSPMVCNFITPEKWHVFKRRASQVRVFRPFNIPETKKLIEKAKTSNWELYKNHIANSQLYSV